MQEDFENLIQWSQQFDYLPWRQQRSLYKTLVSEIMLQQTTVATVYNKFESFIEQFPDISGLAKATEEHILIAWKGLGYYRRAKNLLAAANYIHTQYSGLIPCDYNLLITIPSIGDYTARAILAIGAEQKKLAIDVNLQRVLGRYYGFNIESQSTLKKNILKQFESNKILDFELSFRALNEALMDLGRVYCTKNNTHCNLCPLQYSCQSKNKPPIEKNINNKNNKLVELKLLRILIVQDNKILCYKKNNIEWLSGQFECPTFIINENNELKQYPYIPFEYIGLKSFKTNITKYKITNYILNLSLEDFNNRFTWTRRLEPISLLTKNNISTATQKAIILQQKAETTLSK